MSHANEKCPNGWEFEQNVGDDIKIVILCKFYIKYLDNLPHQKGAAYDFFASQACQAGCMGSALASCHASPDHNFLLFGSVWIDG